jgi:hypothetical protein
MSLEENKALARAAIGMWNTGELDRAERDLHPAHGLGRGRAVLGQQHRDEPRSADRLRR